MPDQPHRPFCPRCKSSFDSRESFRAHADACLADWVATRPERDRAAAERKRLDGYRRVIRALRLASEAKERGVNHA